MTQTQRSAQSQKRRWHFSPRVWWRVFRRVSAAADHGNLGPLAAGVAFYAMLSIFPAMAATIAIWGFVADPLVIQDQLEMTRQLLPDDAFLLLNTQVTALIAANNSTLQLASILSILLAVWTSRSAVATVIRGLNVIYDENQHTPLKRYAMALGLTFLLIVLAILAFAAVVIIPAILAYVQIPVGLEVTIIAVKWVILLVAVFFGVGLLYRYGPNRSGAKVPWFTPGAIMALGVWALASFAFSTYLRNFGSFNEVYGSLGAIVGLLFWFYISAYIVLLGAQLNAELERGAVAE
ncbi:MAG: YihY/virulence factor BrkB family protein [Paracoccaceae bacterium]